MDYEFYYHPDDAVRQMIAFADRRSKRLRESIEKLRCEEDAYYRMAEAGRRFLKERGIPEHAPAPGTPSEAP